MHSSASVTKSMKALDAYFLRHWMSHVMQLRLVDRRTDTSQTHLARRKPSWHEWCLINSTSNASQSHCRRHTGDEVLQWKTLTKSSNTETTTKRHLQAELKLSMVIRTIAKVKDNKWLQC